MFILRGIFAVLDFLGELMYGIAKKIGIKPLESLVIAVIIVGLALVFGEFITELATNLWDTHVVEAFNSGLDFDGTQEFNNLFD